MQSAPSREGNTGRDAPLLSVDTPDGCGENLVHNELVVAGWALDAVRVHLESEAGELDAELGLESVDVKAIHPGRRGSASARYMVRCPTADWPAGLHPISIVATGPHGERSQIDRDVAVAPYDEPGASTAAGIVAAGIALHLDRPPPSAIGPSEIPVDVTGWCFATAGVDRIEVIVDGRDRYDALFPVLRDDVAAALGMPAASLSGFELALPTELCSAGGHSLVVIAHTRGRRPVGRSIAFVCEASPSGPGSVRPGTDGVRPVRRWTGDDDLPNGERFMPDFHRGTMIEVEHRARYRWASPLARGRTVLDAACGVGYGSAVLARGGAKRVVGIDTSEAALRAARAGAIPETEFVSADIRALPFADGEFDLVVSFETIEHVEDPERALDELRRVLAPEGVLVISTPNREVYAAQGEDNPWHIRELTESELAEALRARFAHVRLAAQQTSIASTLGELRSSPTPEGEHVLDAELISLVPIPEPEPIYSIALASDGALPSHPGLVMLGQAAALRDYLRQLRLRVDIAESHTTASLFAANTAGAERRAIARKAVALERELARSEAARVAAEHRAADVERTLRQHRESLSWRVSAPLRAAKRRYLRDR
jgi:SAM-dependent methyltransferase